MVREAILQTFRAYFIDHNRRLSATKLIEAISDQEALASAARGMGESSAADVWQATRRVGRVDRWISGLQRRTGLDMQIRQSRLHLAVSRELLRTTRELFPETDETGLDSAEEPIADGWAGTRDG
jgi:pyridoxal biosynthesis lyase PdxS